MAGLTKRDFKRVERWLYEIPRKYIRLDNLRTKLEFMDRKAKDGPPGAKIPHLKDICVQEGSSEGTEGERWAEWADWYARTRPGMVEEIARLELKISFYERVVAEFDKSDTNKIHHRLIRLKYHDEKKNFQICEELHVSRRTFYRMRERIVKTFFECLPGEFLNGGI